ncbi:MAG: glutathione S-transferase family protein [Gammaproteobacteria bacterium]|nr:MAG: glutathione S-transferase family protein [Gammaproteobacteria bacterium]
MELYSYDACPFAQRSRIVLAEKGLDYELHEVDVHNKPAGWERISPYGKVPVLLDGGGRIYESRIINEYLDEAYPEPPLMPGTPLARAEARIWIDYCDTRFLPASHRYAWADDAGRTEAAAELDEVLRFLEREGLAHSGPYWLGKEVSLVDFHYLPFVERLAVHEQLHGYRWPADCRRLRDWYAAVCERPSVKGTLRPAEWHIEQHRRLREAIEQRRAAGG